tara:strand:- start:3289 stop:3621 length:333 start_codon:yes stop_codon:yes gene_type:complete
MNITKEARQAVEEAAYSLESFYTADLIDFTDKEKDCICKAFLLNDDNWCDDILPPMIDRDNYSEWLELIYGYFVGGALHIEYRNAIYLYIEGALSEIIGQAQAEMKKEVK